MGYALNLYSRGFGAPARDLEIIIYGYIVYLYIFIYIYMYMYICTHMIIIRNNRKPRYFCCPNFFLDNNSFVKQLAKKGIHKEAGAQKIVPELPRFQVRDCALVDQVQSGAWVGVSSVVVVFVFVFLAWYYRTAFKELCQKIKDLPSKGRSDWHLDHPQEATV